MSVMSSDKCSVLPNPHGYILHTIICLKYVAGINFTIYCRFLPPGAALHRTAEDVQQLPSARAVWFQRASAHLRCPDVRTHPTPVQHRHADGQQDLPEQTQHGHEVHLLRREVGTDTGGVTSRRAKQEKELMFVTDEDAKPARELKPRKANNETKLSLFYFHASIFFIR